MFLLHVLLWCKYVWMKFYYFLSSSPSYGSFVQFVFCIGDGFVEGFGDRFALGSSCGLSGRLNHLASDKRFKLRMNWCFMNFGRYGSCTDDWLPSSSTCYLSKVCQHRFFKKTKVILIMLGSLDTIKAEHPEVPEKTIDNLRILCDHLIGLGKIVYLATIPQKNQASSDGVRFCNKERNKLLRKMIESDTSGRLFLGPECDHGVYFNKELYCRDQIHFNSQGYKKLSYQWMNVIENKLRNIEWEFWKNQLHSKNK